MVSPIDWSSVSFLTRDEVPTNAQSKVALERQSLRKDVDRSIRDLLDKGDPIKLKPVTSVPSKLALLEQGCITDRYTMRKSLIYCKFTVGGPSSILSSNPTIVQQMGLF